MAPIDQSTWVSELGKEGEKSGLSLNYHLPNSSM